MANITEIKGNIFESTCQTIVNAVNCVGIMGKGIALEYKFRYPEMYDAYVNECENKRLKPGILFLWKKSNPWILNFPTKYHWKYPSKMEYIELGLKKFSDTFHTKGITSIAFPKLGTSAGGLYWDSVKELMLAHLEPLRNLEVEIYHYDPTVTDSLFDQLYQKVHRFSVIDYVEYVRLRKKEARIIHWAIQNNSVKNMMDLQDLKGFGEKSLEKIYHFLESNKNSRIITDNEKQPGLGL